MRVLAAMSGGVDSSVAAAAMVGEGHEVIGVTLKLWEGPGGEAPTAGCCTVSDAEDARRVAAQLGIAYYVLDYTDEFRDGVVDRFITEYRSGRTPNPCVECNRVVKFDLLLQRAAELDCDLVVTGHYARTQRTSTGFELLRAVDPDKDQSYVLYMLTQAALRRVRFPVGHLTKAETRAEAQRLELRTAGKPDSQDVCFVGKGGYRTFLRRHGEDHQGLIVDLAGQALGRHRGVANFTVGQRRGLGLAAGEPRYVIRLEPDQDRVVVGTRQDLQAVGCLVTGMSWVAGGPPESQEVEVKLRYLSPALSAEATPAGEDWKIRFRTPQASVAPGQAAVLYRGDVVLGGGTIERALR